MDQKEIREQLTGDETMTMTRKNLLVTVAVLTLAMWGGAMIVGCNGDDIAKIKNAIGIVNEQRAPVQAVIDQARKDRQALNVKIPSMPLGGERDKAIETSQQLTTIIDVGQQGLDIANKTLIDLRGRLEGAKDGADVVEAALQTAAPFIPPPWGLLVTGAGGLAVGLYRAWKNKAAGKSAVRSVNPTVEEKLKDSPDEAKRIRIAQSPAAKRLVDEVQGKRFSLPF